MAQIPRVLKNFSLFIDGRGMAGLIQTMTLPTLTTKMEEFRGGGMDAPIELDMGMEKLEGTFELAEYNPDVIALFGLASADTQLTARGAIRSDGEAEHLASVGTSAEHRDGGGLDATGRRRRDRHSRSGEIARALGSDRDGQDAVSGALMAEAWSDEHPRRKADSVLSSQESVSAFIGASRVVDAADHVGDRCAFISACGDADHDADRTGLVVDQVQRGLQGAGNAETCHLTTPGNQYRSVEWKERGISVRRCADKTDNAGAHGLNWPGSSVNLEHLHTMEEGCSHVENPPVSSGYGPSSACRCHPAVQPHANF